jgi:hypothetical protein
MAASSSACQSRGPLIPVSSPSPPPFVGSNAANFQGIGAAIFPGFPTGTSIWGLGVLPRDRDATDGLDPLRADLDALPRPFDLRLTI